MLNQLTGTDIPSTAKPFETTKPEIGMIDYEGVKIQLIDIPSTFKGFNKKYPNHIALLRTSDLIVILGDSKVPIEELKQAELTFY